MVWLVVEDSYFYDEKDNYSLLRKRIAFSNKNLAIHLDNLYKEGTLVFKLVFDFIDAKRVFRNKDYKNTVIISPFNPKELNINSSFFGVFKVENTDGILTSSENLVGLQKQNKLNQKLGLQVHKSDFNFSNSNQDERLVEVAKLLTLKYMTGEIPKAVFLSGVVGTGKSFFAQCLAGETNRLLVSFNLANIMNEPNPLKAFDEVIDYLANNNSQEKYLLWIDEIDKIFNNSPESEHIKNKFLTFLNDLGLTIDIDTFIVMTANKVDDILKKFPEMIRAGRVEPFAKIFLDMIEPEDATKTAELYIKKRNSEDTRLNLIANTMAWINEDNMLFINEFKKFKFFSLIYNKETEIKKITLDNQQYKLTKKEIINLYKDEIHNIFNNEELQKILNSLLFRVTSNKIIDYINRNYKYVHKESKITSFFYVNAEIKEIVTQMYFSHLNKEFSDDNDENVEKALQSIIINNIAIVDASFDNYKNMAGNTKSFSIVIGSNANKTNN